MDFKDEDNRFPDWVFFLRVLGALRGSNRIFRLYIGCIERDDGLGKFPIAGC
jgi:hypothetical protein